MRLFFSKIGGADREKNKTKLKPDTKMPLEADKMIICCFITKSDTFHIRDFLSIVNIKVIISAVLIIDLDCNFTFC